MRLRSICNDGFTLFEVLITISILSMIAFLGPISDVSIFKRSGLKNMVFELNELALKAKNRALNNVNDMDHGIYLQSGKVIIFSGEYDPHSITNMEYIFPDLYMDLPQEIVFERLSGATLYRELSIAYGRSTTTLHITNQGINSR